MHLEADIYINEAHFKTITLKDNSSPNDFVHLEIPASDLLHQKKHIAPELQSIESILKENIHSIRKSVSEETPLADIIESGDISIRLKDGSGRFYKMIQILDMNFAIHPTNVDFFECDADIDEFGFYLLCTIEQSQNKSAIILTFRPVVDKQVIESVKAYRQTRDLRILDLGSGICLNVKSLPPDTESEENNFEIGQLILLERLLSKIQRNRISKKNRRRYYILGERIFRELQRKSN